MRRLAVVLALVAVIGLGAYFGLSAVSNRSVQQGLEQALQKLPPGWTASYKSVDFTPATNTTVLKGVQVHHADAPKLDAAIDEVEISGPSLDLGSNWAQAVQNPSAAAPDKAVPVADGVTVKGLSIHVEGQEVQIGSTRITKLRLYPWALLHAGVPGYGDIVNLAQHSAADPKPEDMLPVLRFEAAYLLGVGFESYAADDIAARFKLAPDGATPVEVAYTVRKVEAAGVDRGKIATTSLDAITVKQGEDIDVSVAHAGLTGGVDVRNVMTQVLSGAGLDPAILDGIMLGKLEYSGISAKVPSGPPVTLARVAFSNVAVAHGMLISADLSVEGFKVVKAQLTDETMLDAFDKLGLETATLSFGGAYKWDVDKKTAALTDVEVKVDELAKMTLSADFAGIEKTETIDQTAMLKHAVLHYTDASLAGRALKAAAEENGAAPEQFRQQLTGIIKVQGDQFGDSPGIAAVTKAIGEFLADPHSLTIELTPPQPLLLASLAADHELPPAEILAKFGLAVTANR